MQIEKVDPDKRVEGLFESLMFDVTTSATHASNPAMLPNFSDPQTYNIGYPSPSNFLNL